MKRILLIMCWLAAVATHAQSLQAFQEAIGDPGKKVQAKHFYPPDIKDGKHHYVEITAIAVQGNDITITEDWTDLRGNRAQTILKGKLTGNTIKETWKSTYSRGKWECDTTTGTGRWNKTHALFNINTFDHWQKLSFSIVASKSIKDGFFD